jgi:hypothetical protein
VDYLVNGQVTSQDDRDGGWPIRTTLGFPVIEATVWAVRALAGHAGLLPSIDPLRRGLAYIERQQNTDFGWGSYRGEPSRVFHTALSMLALEEAGGSRTVLENGQKWLIDAQNPSQPAWGPLPNSEPTVLHTSIALAALHNRPGALPANSVRESGEWILQHLIAGVHTEKGSQVEEFDLPFRKGSETLVFQNSLPHFAGPNGLAAVLDAGIDPLQPKVLELIRGIAADQQETGAWELPKSPTRPSIWAIWPFISALSTARRRLLPTPSSTLTLLYPGCGIVQNDAQAKPLTAARLVRNTIRLWLGRRRVNIALWVIAVVSAALPTLMLVTRKIDLADFGTAIIFPALLLIFQLAWEFRKRGKLL